MSGVPHCPKLELLLSPLIQFVDLLRLLGDESIFAKDFCDEAKLDLVLKPGEHAKFHQVRNNLIGRLQKAKLPAPAPLPPITGEMAVGDRLTIHQLATLLKHIFGNINQVFAAFRQQITSFHKIVVHCS